MKRNLIAAILFLCIVTTACTPEPAPTSQPTSPPTNPPQSPVPPTPTREIPTQPLQPTRAAPTASLPAPSATPLPEGVLLIIPVGDPEAVTGVISPDGQWVGMIRGDTVEIWSVEKGTLVGQVQPNGGAEDLLFSPDGTSFATCHQHQEGDPYPANLTYANVYVWSIGSNGIDPEPTLLRNRSWWTTVVRYSPDGQMMLVGSTHGEVYIWDIQSGEALSTLKLHDDFTESVAMAPDGDLYASEGTPVDYRTLVSKLSDPGWQLTLQQNYQGEGRVFFSPDGSRLAYWSDNGTTLVNTTSWGIERFLLYIFAEGFTPDGKSLLVYEENETQVIAIETKAVVATYPVAPATFLPDGRVLGLMTEGGNLVLRQFAP